MKSKYIRKMVKPGGSTLPMQLDYSIKFFVESSDSVSHLIKLLETQITKGDSEYIDFLLKQFNCPTLEMLAIKMQHYYRDVVLRTPKLMENSYRGQSNLNITH
jgi:hypothetical protein